MDLTHQEAMERAQALVGKFSKIGIPVEIDPSLKPENHYFRYVHLIFKKCPPLIERGFVYGMWVDVIPGSVRAELLESLFGMGVNEIIKCSAMPEVFATMVGDKEANIRRAVAIGLLKELNTCKEQETSGPQ